MAIIDRAAATLVSASAASAGLRAEQAFRSMQPGGRRASGGGIRG